MSLPATRTDWLQCSSLSFYCPMTSRMRRWEDLRENLQQHIRILADEAWPLDVRESRQALLRPSLSAGWALTEHAAMTRSNYFSGEGSIPCYSLRCAQCPIGEVTLRSAVLLTASKEILQTLLSPEKPQATRNLVTYSLWDTLGKIDSLLFVEDVITWYDILNSGWPIFAILASLATLITGSKFLAENDELRVRRDLAKVLRPQSLEEEVSSYLGPDMSQYKRWLQLAMQRPMGCWAPTILGTLMVADGARSMAMPLPVEDFIRIAQSDVRSCRSPMESFTELLQWPWPLFETLDWLQTPAEVQVRILPSRLYQHWWWFKPLPETTGKLVAPRGRRPGTYGFVGDNIRSTRRPHCNLIFQNAWDVLKEFLPGPINVVDVGSMLGDCCLWTLKRTRPLGLCRAFESNMLWARLATTSAELNGFRKEMQISEVLVRPEGPNSLDALLMSDLGGASWVLKMHVDGTELELLQGAVELLKSGRVPLAVVRMDWQLQLNDGAIVHPQVTGGSF